MNNKKSISKTFLRKPLMSLSLAQKCYGIDKTTFLRPQYVGPGHCQWCGKLITEKRRKSFCSNECSYKFNVATSPVYFSNHGSRGGYANHILRRDNYSCKECGDFHGLINEHGIRLPTTDGEIEIHHIRQVQYGGDDSPGNLVALCKKCHLKIHKKNKPVL
jgi:5-methylcytosine-specific restriction protein A